MCRKSGDWAADGDSGVQSTQLWCDELTLTEGLSGLVDCFGDSTGHYTQVVWCANIVQQEIQKASSPKTCWRLSKLERSDSNINNNVSDKL